jgi:hypothetical protein
MKIIDSSSSYKKLILSAFLFFQVGFLILSNIKDPVFTIIISVILALSNLFAKKYCSNVEDVFENKLFKTFSLMSKFYIFTLIALIYISIGIYFYPGLLDCWYHDICSDDQLSGGGVVLVILSLILAVYCVFYYVLPASFGLLSSVIFIIKFYLSKLL